LCSYIKLNNNKIQLLNAIKSRLVKEKEKTFSGETAYLTDELLFFADELYFNKKRHPNGHLHFSVLTFFP
jgi:hypothetical protein